MESLKLPPFFEVSHILATITWREKCRRGGPGGGGGVWGVRGVPAFRPPGIHGYVHGSTWPLNTLKTRALDQRCNSQPLRWKKGRQEGVSAAASDIWGAFIYDSRWRSVLPQWEFNDSCLSANMQIARKLKHGSKFNNEIFTAAPCW